MHNPSLRAIPAHEPAEVIPSKQEISLIAWLEATGRMVARDSGNAEALDYLDDEEEISDLMSVDDGVFEDDDADDEDDLLED